MKIIHYELMSETDFLDKLKTVRLRGFGGVEVYKDASLSIVEDFDTELLVPPQRYVLTGTLDSILQLADDFADKGVDIFALRSALLFWLEGGDPNVDDPIPLLPPIVEESYERGGEKILIVNDGMHRIYSARMRDRRPNIVRIDNIPREYPYYAYGILDGWSVVEELPELPDSYQKKDYRNPDNYKALFRDFNTPFPGVQKQRKQSNPSHIKE